MKGDVLKKSVTDPQQWLDKLTSLSVIVESALFGSDIHAVVSNYNASFFLETFPIRHLRTCHDRCQTKSLVQSVSEEQKLHHPRPYCCHNNDNSRTANLVNSFQSRQITRAFIRSRYFQAERYIDNDRQAKDLYEDEAGFQAVLFRTNLLFEPYTKVI